MRTNVTYLCTLAIVFINITVKTFATQLLHYGMYKAIYKVNICTYINKYTHTLQIKLHLFRFPINNPKVLGKCMGESSLWSKQLPWLESNTLYIHLQQALPTLRLHYSLASSENEILRLKSTAVPTIFNSSSNPVSGIPKKLRKNVEHSCNPEVLTTVSYLDIVNHDHTYCKKSNTIEDLKEDQDRKTLDYKLKIKACSND